MLWLPLLIPIVSIIAVFTFVSIAAWAENRRKERETYYRHETYRKIMEHPDEATRAVVEMMRERELQQQRKRVEGMRLGGLITFVVGIGVMVFLYYLIDEPPIYLAGLIVLLIGLVLMVHGFFIAKSPDDKDVAGGRRGD
jgi:Flp pilus assembly protein TadB